MTLTLADRPAWLRWLVLIALSVLLAAAFSVLRVAAALLIAPMAAAILLAVRDAGVAVPRPLFSAAQAVIGMMIARSMRLSLLVAVSGNWPVFVFAVSSLIVTACGLGWLLTRWRVLPGTAALWGSFPGAAAAMMLMAEEFGADIRLVAFMQYFRVVIVALVASGVARWFDVTGAAASVPLPISWGWLAATLALTAAGAAAGLAARLPAGALLGPMVLGAGLQGAGWLRIELPPAGLAVAYAIVGWSIGGRFTREILGHVATAWPCVAAAILALIAACALFAIALVHMAGVDPLTAYLAMSPGGADTIAIVAASAHKVDLPFVMALQMSRFLFVLAVGPSLARFLARHAGADPSAAPDAKSETRAKTAD